MYFRFRTAEHAAELFIRDVTDGIGGTGIRPGFVKCGIDSPGMTPAVEIGIRAAAMTHRATGVPVSAHTWTGNRSGEQLVEVLVNEGVDMRRVVIGHSGDTEDLGYLRGLLATGAWLGMDRFGVEDRLPDDRRVEVIASLCREGYANRLVMSTDASYWSGRLSNEHKQQTRPHWSPWRIFDFAIPKLLEAGVTQEQLELMLVGNPRSIFTPDQPY
jgi:phosphotriesterase-related protein